MTTLSEDILCSIFSSLPGKFILTSISLVCKQFHDVCSKDILWRKVTLRDFSFVEMFENVEDVHRKIMWKRLTVLAEPLKGGDGFHVFKDVTVGERSKGMFKIVDKFVTGVAMGGEILLSVMPSEWDGSLCRAILLGNKGKSQQEILTIVNQLRGVLNTGLIDIECFDEQLAGLIELFYPGEYELTFQQSYVRPIVYEMPFPKIQLGWEGTHTFRNSQSSLNRLHADADTGNLIFFSQCMDIGNTAARGSPKIEPLPSMQNEERIEYYKAIISKGARPVIFAIRVHDDFIIIDGHHKFIAYLDFPEIDPAYIFIAGKENSNFYDYFRSNGGNYESWMSNSCLSHYDDSPEMTEEELHLVAEQPIGAVKKNFATMMYLMKENPIQMIEYYKQKIEEENTDDDHYRIGYIYSKMGDMDSARHHLQIVLNSGYMSQSVYDSLIKSD